MPFVPALCPQCGATLEVDPSQEAALCKFCNTPFITEKAVTNYNITYNTTNVSNTTNVNNISNSEVHIHQNDEDAQTLLDNIKVQLKQNNTGAAWKNLQKMQEKFPADYRTDEAATAYNLYHIYDTEQRSFNAQSAYLFPLAESIGRLSVSNREVAKTYCEQIQNNVNEYVNKLLGTNFSGGLYFYKLIAMNFSKILDTFKKYVDYSYPLYANNVEAVSPNEFQLNLLYDLANGTNRHISDLSSVCETLESGKEKWGSAKIPSDPELHGNDDEFCEYMVNLAKRFEQTYKNRFEAVNNTLKRNGWNSTLINVGIFDRMKNAPVRLMTPDGVARHNRKLAEEAENMRRAEQLAREKYVADTTTQYRDLLSRGKTKEAFALLEKENFLDDKSEEMKKFKKTLFGLKYNG